MQRSFHEMSSDCKPPGEWRRFWFLRVIPVRFVEPASPAPHSPHSANLSKRGVTFIESPEIARLPIRARVECCGGGPESSSKPGFFPFSFYYLPSRSRAHTVKMRESSIAGDGKAMKAGSREVEGDRISFNIFGRTGASRVAASVAIAETERMAGARTLVSPIIISVTDVEALSPDRLLISRRKSARPVRSNGVSQ